MKWFYLLSRGTRKQPSQRKIRKPLQSFGEKANRPRRLCDKFHRLPMKGYGAYWPVSAAVKFYLASGRRSWWCRKDDVVPSSRSEESAEKNIICTRKGRAAAFWALKYKRCVRLVAGRACPRCMHHARTILSTAMQIFAELQPT